MIEAMNGSIFKAVMSPITCLSVRSSSLTAVLPMLAWSYECSSCQSFLCGPVRPRVQGLHGPNEKDMKKRMRGDNTTKTVVM